MLQRLYSAILPSMFFLMYLSVESVTLYNPV